LDTGARGLEAGHHPGFGSGGVTTRAMTSTHPFEVGVCPYG
jgi:hypothetical protein